jgi:hypothetical protein
VVAGLYNVTVNVTDSNGFLVTSGVLAFSVFSDPVVTTPSSYPTIVDLGHSAFMTSTSTGGSSGNVYTWGGLPGGCVSNDALTIACSPIDVGSFSVTITVTDSNRFSETSAAMTFIVLADPIAATPTVTPASIDLNQSATFSVQVSLGSGGYQYSWYGLPDGCASTDSSTVVCEPNAAGGFSVYVTVVDSNSYSVTSNSLAFTVYTDPVAGRPASSSGSVDVGQFVSFHATSTGGTGSYASYVWSFLPVGLCEGTVSPNVTCIPSSPAPSLYISVKVTDSNGYTSQSSAMLHFAVYPDPTISTPVASPTRVLDVGQWTNLTASATTGSGAATYSWFGLPGGCSLLNPITESCGPTSQGTYDVSVSIQDSDGVNVTSGVLTLVVSPPMKLGALTTSVGSLNVGQSVTLSVVASGGSGSFTYGWKGLPQGCTAASLASLTCSPALASTTPYRIYVTVSDSNGLNLTSNATTLLVDPQVTVVSLTASRYTLDLGQSLNLTAVLSGGTEAYSIVWHGLPSGCTSANTGTLPCSPLISDVSTIWVTVNDSHDQMASSGALTLVVYPRLSASPGASSISVQAGSTITFFAGTSGGDEPLSYLWTFGDGTTSTLANPAHLFSLAGYYPVQLTVTDSAGVHVSMTVSVNVTSVSAPASTLLGVSTTAGLLIIALLMAVIVLAILVVSLLIRNRENEPSEPSEEKEEEGRSEGEEPEETSEEEPSEGGEAPSEEGDVDQEDASSEEDKVERVGENGEDED